MCVANMKQALRRVVTCGLNSFYEKHGHKAILEEGGVAVLAPKFVFQDVDAYDSFFEYLRQMGEAERLRRVDIFHNKLREMGRCSFFKESDRTGHDGEPTQSAKAFAECFENAFGDAPSNVARFLTSSKLLSYNAHALNSATHFAGYELARSLGILITERNLKQKNLLAVALMRKKLLQHRDLTREIGMTNGQLKDAFSGLPLRRLDDNSIFEDPSQSNDPGPFPDAWLLVARAMQSLVAALNKGKIRPLLRSFGITASKVSFNGRKLCWVYQVYPEVAVDTDQLPDNLKKAPPELEAA
jgi:hypothetical protein